MIPADVASAATKIEMAIDKQRLEINRVGFVLYLLLIVLLLALIGASVAVDRYMERWEPVEIDPEARTINGNWTFWNDTITISLNVTDAQGTIAWTNASGYAISVRASGGVVLTVIPTEPGNSTIDHLNGRVMVRVCAGQIVLTICEERVI